METPIKTGYLLLADLSGFTSFMAESELDHGPQVLHRVMTMLVEQLTPTLKLAEIEGDAVFLYAPNSAIPRGEFLVELIQSTYAYFHDQKRTVQHNLTCPCIACQSVSRLDLKFVVHHGRFALQTIAGKTKPLGTCVNLAHRLLKNSVKEKLGWEGYALFSDASLDQMNVCLDDAQQLTESYEHIGEVGVSAINLSAWYHDLVHSREVRVAREDAQVAITHEFSLPVPVLWDWLNDPVKKNQWAKGADWESLELPLGRRGLNAKYHCTNSGAIEEILDWRPFQYFTVCNSVGLVRFTITGEIRSHGHRSSLTWLMRMEGPLPKWLRASITRFVAKHVLGVEQGFTRLEELAGADAARVADEAAESATGSNERVESADRRSVAGSPVGVARP